MVYVSTVCGFFLVPSFQIFGGQEVRIEGRVGKVEFGVGTKKAMKSNRMLRTVRRDGGDSARPGSKVWRLALAQVLASRIIRDWRACK